MIRVFGPLGAILLFIALHISRESAPNVVFVP